MKNQPMHDMWIMFYAYNWVILLVLPAVYIIAGVRFRRRFVSHGGFRNLKQRAVVSKVAHQTWLYPLVLYLVWIPCSINRVLEDVTGETKRVAGYMELTLLPLMGFFNFLIYFFTAELISDFGKLFTRVRLRRGTSSMSIAVNVQNKKNPKNKDKILASDPDGEHPEEKQPLVIDGETDNKPVTLVVDTVPDPEYDDT
ncbi:hypothetical protein Pelo_1165 [Pelomyxa schiedti]|nr:hypothetical protein Pelo_1165 [Pelomyxa schiedti]